MKTEVFFLNNSPPRTWPISRFCVHMCVVFIITSTAGEEKVGAAQPLLKKLMDVGSFDFPPSFSYLFSDFWQMDWVVDTSARRDPLFFKVEIPFRSGDGGKSFSSIWTFVTNGQHLIPNARLPFTRRKRENPRRRSDFCNRRSKATVWKLNHAVISNGK